MTIHPPLIPHSPRHASPALNVLQSVITAVAIWRMPRRRKHSLLAMPQHLRSDVLPANELRYRGEYRQKPYISGSGKT